MYHICYGYLIVEAIAYIIVFHLFLWTSGETCMKNWLYIQIYLATIFRSQLTYVLKWIVKNLLENTLS